MTLDSEIQRQLIWQMLNLGKFQGEYAEAVVALKEAIRSADIQTVPPGPEPLPEEKRP